MSDLAAFLTARLDEQAKLHERRDGDHWWYDQGFNWRADIDAKRQVIELWEDANGRRPPLPDGVHERRDPDEIERNEAIAEVLDHVLHLFALPYQSHPDYDQAWRPGTGPAS